MDTMSTNSIRDLDPGCLEQGFNHNRHLHLFFSLILVYMNKAYNNITVIFNLHPNKLIFCNAHPKKMMCCTSAHCPQFH